MTTPALIAVERTQQFSPEVQQAAGRVYCVYLYDACQEVQYKEPVPSYALEPLYYVTEDHVPDEVGEELIRAADQAQDQYMWCQTIERMESRCKEDAGLFESLSEAAEYFTSNPWGPKRIH
ncbi:hypothetical protein [Neptuniibacter sp. QD37_11]|uniref:hypothetical protein n=1 Tax=Neptuniibacter sp. QD37_11 TaxID=3398209 RepID=UPI0039F5058B